MKLPPLLFTTSAPSPLPLKVHAPVPVVLPFKPSVTWPLMVSVLPAAMVRAFAPVFCTSSVGATALPLTFTLLAFVLAMLGPKAMPSRFGASPFTVTVPPSRMSAPAQGLDAPSVSAPLPLFVRAPAPLRPALSVIGCTAVSVTSRLLSTTLELIVSPPLPEPTPLLRLLAPLMSKVPPLIVVPPA